MSKPATPRAPPSFAALVQSFFTEHLTQQRAMSPRTVATYRDGFVLFLDFATVQLHKQPTTMKLPDSSSRDTATWARCISSSRRLACQ